MISFVGFDEDNPLTEYAAGKQSIFKTSELQSNNPALCSELVNIHLRRIIWNRGIYRDADIFYFPMLDHTKEIRYVEDRKKKQRWIVKKYIHAEDSLYAKKGETNFFFHRGVEIATPTYWSTAYIEVTPRKYYTFDGSTPIEGEIRKRLDSKFRNPLFDRCRTRVGLMRLWKHVLFESSEYAVKPEKWFSAFRFGDFVKQVVDWRPEVIERDQTRALGFWRRIIDASFANKGT